MKSSFYRNTTCILIVIHKPQITWQCVSHRNKTFFFLLHLLVSIMVAIISSVIKIVTAFILVNKQQFCVLYWFITAYIGALQLRETQVPSLGLLANQSASSFNRA